MTNDWNEEQIGPVNLDEADPGQALIYIPAIVIAELYYLNEKKGGPLDFRTKYARQAQSKQFVLLPFYPSHTLDFDACSAVTEMHDRAIAADARRPKTTLLTRDAQIASSGVVSTVWQGLNRSAYLTSLKLSDTGAGDRSRRHRGQDPSRHLLVALPPDVRKVSDSLRPSDSN